MAVYKRRESAASMPEQKSRISTVVRSKKGGVNIEKEERSHGLCQK